MTTTIGIVGANGRVGSEVTLLLHCMEDVTVVPVTRSTYAAAFLNRCGLSTRVAPSEASLRAALANCHAVVDLTVPMGSLSAEQRHNAASQVRRLMAQIPTTARFIYASSIMALGMAPGERTVRRHRLARSNYGVQKRRAEREVRSASRGRETFILRLGEVHGDLQPVTGHYIDAVRWGLVRLQGGLDTDSNVVTCYTIANSIRNIALGREAPGIYTVVERPDWSWQAFFEWVATNLDIDVSLEEASPADTQTSLRSLPHWATDLASRVVQVAARNKGLLTSYLPMTPEREYRLKIQHLKRKAASEIAEQPAEVPVHDLMVGPIPGRRLRSLEGLNDRWAVQRCVRTRLDERLGSRSHHFPAYTAREPFVP